MGPNHGKHRILTKRPACKAGAGILTGDDGDAVIEAAILFPFMTAIFAALVLVALYLPAEAILQQSTQYAATALATELSDTWLRFSEHDMGYYWEKSGDNLPGVYGQMFSVDAAAIADRGGTIVAKAESRGFNSRAGELSIECSIDDKIIYSEITIKATREYAVPVDLSIINFPRTIKVSSASTAVVQNSEEFIRNIDLAAGFARFCADKFGLSDIGESINDYGEKVRNILGW